MIIQGFSVLEVLLKPSWDFMSVRNEIHFFFLFPEDEKEVQERIST